MGEIMRPRLVGVGTGPGDPSLLTVKAIEILKSADAILVPVADTSSSEIGRAEAIVTEMIPEAAPAIRRVPFSMKQRRGVGDERVAAWQASADAAVAEFEAGAHIVAFATVGDPSVYSTFSYLSDYVTKQLDVDVEVVPGITAMQALAAASLTPLVEGQEILALIPATVGQDHVSRVAEVADTLTIYKGGRQLAALKDTLSEAGRTGAVMGTDIGLDSERIVAVDDIDDERAPYFSTIIAPATRGATGGRI